MARAQQLVELHRLDAGASHGLGRHVRVVRRHDEPEGLEELGNTPGDRTEGKQARPPPAQSAETSGLRPLPVSVAYVPIELGESTCAGEDERNGVRCHFFRARIRHRHDADRAPRGLGDVDPVDSDSVADDAAERGHRVEQAVVRPPAETFRRSSASRGLSTSSGNGTT